jgi:hypothetical protein
MPVAMLIEFPEGTADEYDRVMSEMKLEGTPEGAIVHIAVAMDDALRVLDVWESREAFDRFYESQLGPALAAAVSTDREPKFHEVLNVMSVEHQASQV